MCVNSYSSNILKSSRINGSYVFLRTTMRIKSYPRFHPNTSKGSISSADHISGSKSSLFTDHPLHSCMPTKQETRRITQVEKDLYSEKKIKKNLWNLFEFLFAEAFISAPRPLGLRGVWGNSTEAQQTHSRPRRIFLVFWERSRVSRNSNL